jgi:cytochrome b
MAGIPTPDPIRVRVWDVPIRLVHWLMVLLVAAAWWTAEAGRLDWHLYCGYALLGLVSFRIYWGLAGSSTARFSQFVRGPRTVLDYLKGRWVAAPGHNPIGALSIVALLSSLLAQTVLGLFAVDVDGVESGPLSRFISFDAGRMTAEWHDELFDYLLGLIALHIAAVLYYVLHKKENLIGAMFHGRRNYPVDLPPVTLASITRLLLGVVLAALLTWVVARAFQFA